MLLLLLFLFDNVNLCRLKHSCTYVRQIFFFCHGLQMPVDHRNHRLDLTAVIQTQDPKTLECTVFTETRSEELSMFWFRHSPGGSTPMSIYIQNNCSNSQSCVYRLPLGETSDSGTFYCAVASYGHLLFGNGVRSDKKQTGMYSVKAS